MTKKLTQKSKYHENKKRFGVKQKPFLIIFKGVSFAKNCLKPESAPLRHLIGLTEKQLNILHISGILQFLLFTEDDSALEVTSG